MIALLFSLFSLLLGLSQQYSLNLRDSDENPAVTLLRDYVRIKTVQPNPEDGYVQAIKFLRGISEDIGLKFNVVEMEAPNLFAVVMTWEGQNSSLKSILLNSHMDVVPADSTNWIYPPFDAYKTPEGRIYGRGTEDMKSVTIAELEAIRRLKNSGFRPLRSVYVTVMPDEELGGLRGTRPFVQTDYFKSLNVGFDIDEGFAVNKSNTIYIINAEKNAWKFNITAKGIPNHGSSFPQYTAPQRLQVVIDRLMSFRQLQYLKLLLNETLDTVTSVNLVRLGGGDSDNSIPSAVWASFDMRIWEKPDWTFKDVDKLLDSILTAARLGSKDPQENVTIDFLIKSEESGRTPANASNPWWTELQRICMNELNVTCEAHILVPATDGRFIRNLGIPAFGINPFPNTPSTAHQDNEFIDETDFLQGIDRYVKLISNFAMLSADISP